MGLLSRLLGLDKKEEAAPRAVPVAEPSVPQHQKPAQDAAAATDFAGGKAATQPAPEAKPASFGGGPIPGEGAWLQGAMKFNRRQGYSPTQWKQFQSILGIGVDGIPGREVARAVYRFQKANGLESDGKLGKGTQGKLSADTAPAHDPNNAPSSAPMTSPRPQARPDGLGQTQTQADTQTDAAQTQTQTDTTQTQADTQTQTDTAQTQTDQTQADAQQGSGNSLVEGEKRTPSFATDRTKYLTIADQVTSVMEASTTKGDYALLHTLADGGGISYGKHQVTLTSGTLHKVVKAYVEIAKPDAPNAKLLKGYLSRTVKNDPSLIGDQTFLNALRSAGTEQAMKQAQDAVFTENYGEKAWDAAAKNEISSPLGHAMLYDTKIQGGMETLLSRARNQLGGNIGDNVDGNVISERQFLMAFNDLREARLESLAVAAANKGKAKRAEMLRNSKYRCRAFRELLIANNLNVAGPDGEVRIKGPGGGRYTIEGFDNEEVRGSDTAEMLSKLKVIGKATITAGKLNVRFGPSTNTQRIDSVMKGAVLDVVETEGEWFKVRVGDILGYIHSDFADFQAQHPDRQGP